jgi:hypothetical protein
MNEKQPVVFAGQTVGITKISDKIRLVSFTQYNIGFFDEDGCCPLEELYSTVLTEYCARRNKNDQLL